MFFSKFPLKRALSIALLSTTMTLGLPQVSRAECSGLTLWSGVERNNELPFCWDFSMRPNARERYRFRIPADKITQGVSKIRISYDRKFTGSFDPNRIELRIDGESVPQEALDIVMVSEEEVNFVEIAIDFEMLDQLERSDLRGALERGNALEVVFNHVRNPRSRGMFYFRGAFIPANDDVPLYLTLGTWIVTVGSR